MEFGSGDGLETTATTEKADIGQRRSYDSHADISATMTFNTFYFTALIGHKILIINGNMHNAQHRQEISQIS